jgi:hypothetical protein
MEAELIAGLLCRMYKKRDELIMVFKSAFTKWGEVGKLHVFKNIWDLKERNKSIFEFGEG